MDANFIRGFIFTQAAFVFLMTILIVIRYAMKLAVTRKEDRALPWHIMSISASYLGAVIFICIELRERWGLPMSYRVPLSALIFILGDAALLLMLFHLLVQRRMIGAIRDHVADDAIEEKRELAAELKKQTSGLAQMIRNVGQKADDAYNEANDLNQKISGFNEEVSQKLSNNTETLVSIQEHAETARKTAADVSEKADVIGQTGTDTNVRVRDLQGDKPTQPT